MHTRHRLAQGCWAWEEVANQGVTTELEASLSEGGPQASLQLVFPSVFMLIPRLNCRLRSSLSPIVSKQWWLVIHLNSLFKQGLQLLSSFFSPMIFLKFRQLINKPIDNYPLPTWTWHVNVWSKLLFLVWQDSSVDEGACLHTWRPELAPFHLDAARRA